MDCNNVDMVHILVHIVYFHAGHDYNFCDLLTYGQCEAGSVCFHFVRMLDVDKGWDALRITGWQLKIDKDSKFCLITICAKRNTHLIPIFFVAPLGKGSQKFTWSSM